MLTSRRKTKLGAIRNKTVAALMGAALFASCDMPAVYQHYISVDAAGWNKDSVAVFEVPITDTTSLHSIYINLRNNSSYPYSNIYLFVKATAPSGAYTIDTVEYALADEYGRWYGKGFAKKIDNRLAFRKNVQFPHSGPYRFEIQQGMRMEVLPDISEVGITIE